MDKRICTFLSSIWLDKGWQMIGRSQLGEKTAKFQYQSWVEATLSTSHTSRRTTTFFLQLKADSVVMTTTTAMTRQLTILSQLLQQTMLRGTPLMQLITWLRSTHSFHNLKRFRLMIGQLKLKCISKLARMHTLL